MRHASCVQIRPHRISRRLSDRDDSFTPSLPKKSDRPFGQINPIKIEIYDLADTTTRSVEELTECTRALRISCCKFAAVTWSSERHKESFHFIRSEHGGEAASRARQVDLTA